MLLWLLFLLLILYLEVGLQQQPEWKVTLYFMQLIETASAEWMDVVSNSRKLWMYVGVCVHVYGVCMHVVSFDYLTECAKPNETLIIHLVGQIVSSEMTTLPSEPWS